MKDKETSTNLEKNLNRVIKIDEARIHSHLDSMVRDTVEETLNKMLNEEADQLCNAQRYEHTDSRKDTRAGHYNRKLHVKAGVVDLKVPKLRKTTFETAIIERYRRREASVEEALIQMYLAGVSVRRVEDITEALWGTRVSPSTVSELNKKIYGRIESWRNRPIVGNYPYLYLDGLYLKRSWGGEVRNIAILVAVLLTSNLPFSKWEMIFKDPMTTAAAIDRLVHHSVILELNVSSYRVEQARKRKDKDR